MHSFVVRRLSVVLVAVAVMLGVAAADAEAGRRRPAGQHRTSSFEANKTFGLGVMLGAPTGLSGKYFLGPDTAIDFGLGVFRRYRDRDGFHLHADFLWHPLSLVSAEAFELPLYVGIGGRVFSFDHRYDDRDYDGVTAIGVRAPIGIAFDFNDVPLDIFVELALVLDLITNDYYEDFDISLNGAFGIRFWFS